MISLTEAHCTDDFAQNTDSRHYVEHGMFNVLLLAESVSLTKPLSDFIARKYKLLSVGPLDMLMRHIRGQSETYVFLDDKNDFWATQRVVMENSVYECILERILVNDIARHRGFVFSGISFLSKKSLRILISRYFKPQIIINVSAIADDAAAAQRRVFVEPLSTKHFTPSYIEYINNKAEMIFEKRWAPKVIATHDPIHEHNIEDYHLLAIQEWTRYRSNFFKTLRSHPNMTQEEFSMLGMHPDLISVHEKEPLDFKEHMKHYYNILYELRNFLGGGNDIQILPLHLSMPYKFNFHHIVSGIHKLRIKHEPIGYYDCGMKVDPYMANRSGIPKVSEVFKIMPCNTYCSGNTLSNDLRMDYYVKHIRITFDKMSRLFHHIKPEMLQKHWKPKKINFKEVGNLLGGFQDLDDWEISTAATPSIWGRSCPVSTMENATLQRGNYINSINFKHKLYFLRDKEALYKFLLKPKLYSNLKDPICLNVRVILSGHQFSGSYYIAESLSMFFKVPLLNYKNVYNSILALKRLKNYALNLELCIAKTELTVHNSHSQLDSYAQSEEGKFKNFVRWAYKILKAFHFLTFLASNKTQSLSITKRSKRKNHCVASKTDAILPKVNFRVFQHFALFLRGRNDLILKYVKWIKVIANIVRSRTPEPLNKRTLAKSIRKAILYINRRIGSSSELLCHKVFDDPSWLLYYCPREFLPKKEKIAPETVLAGKILNDSVIASSEVLTAVEEIEVLKQAMYQLMVPTLTNPFKDGWVIYGIQVYPELMTRIDNLGLEQLVLYLYDPYFVDYSKFETLGTKRSKAHWCGENHQERHSNLNLRGKNITPSRHVSPACCHPSLNMLREPPLNCEKLPIPKIFRKRHMIKLHSFPVWNIAENIHQYPRIGDAPHVHDTFSHSEHKLVPYWKNLFNRRYIFDHFYSKTFNKQMSNLKFMAKIINKSHDSMLKEILYEVLSYNTEQKTTI